MIIAPYFLPCCCGHGCQRHIPASPARCQRPQLSFLLRSPTLCLRGPSDRYSSPKANHHPHANIFLSALLASYDAVPGFVGRWEGGTNPWRSAAQLSQHSAPSRLLRIAPSMLHLAKDSTGQDSLGLCLFAERFFRRIDQKPCCPILQPSAIS